MKQLLNGLLRQAGRDESFELDDSVGGRDIAAVACNLAEWAVRGQLRRPMLGACGRVLLIGRRVRLRFGSHIYVGQNCIFEDDVEVVGLSRGGIHFGDNVSVGRGTLIKPSSYYGRRVGAGMRIGSRSSIGPGSYLGCAGPIEIGDDVLVGPRVAMHAETHNFGDSATPIREQGTVEAPIRIANNCWIGSDVVVLGGVEIGEGAVIAAGSVVTKTVDQGAIVAGVPANVMRTRL